MTQINRYNSAIREARENFIAPRFYDACQGRAGKFVKMLRDEAIGSVPDQLGLVLLAEGREYLVPEAIVEDFLHRDSLTPARCVVIAKEEYDELQAAVWEKSQEGVKAAEREDKIKARMEETARKKAVKELEKEGEI